MVSFQKRASANASVQSIWGKHLQRTYILRFWDIILFLLSLETIWVEISGLLIKNWWNIHSIDNAVSAEKASIRIHSSDALHNLQQCAYQIEVLQILKLTNITVPIVCFRASQSKNLFWHIVNMMSEGRENYFFSSDHVWCNYLETNINFSLKQKGDNCQKRFCSRKRGFILQESVRKFGDLLLLAATID